MPGHVNAAGRKIAGDSRADSMIPASHRSYHSRSFVLRVFALGVAALALATLAGTAAARGRPEHPPGPEPDRLVAMLRRFDRYMQSHETDGVVLDARVALNATEAARLSVVPQLLAYAELERITGSARFRGDIADRARFLSDRFDEFRSGSVFDGMLGYAFFEAWAATGDPEWLDRGRAIVAELEAIPSSEYILNGGLMAAMAFADDARLTGDAQARALAQQIVAGLPAYENADGSFPHWCVGSRDVHYSDWMATELILIERMDGDPAIAPILNRIAGFIENRIDANGRTVYQEPCAAYPGCVTYYYSIATGCGIDVDTRAFTNELGYSVLLLHHARSPKLAAVTRFLDSLEVGGTIADKWDFPLPPDDPYYPWTAADTSVVNASLLMWSLASTLAERGGPIPGDWRDAPPDTTHHRRSTGHLPVVPGRRPLAAGGADSSSISPRRQAMASGGADPMAGATGAPSEPLSVTNIGAAWSIRFTLPASAVTRLEVFDVGGRRLRQLESGWLPAGSHTVEWDPRSEPGGAPPPGVCFVRLRTPAGARVARITLR